MNEIVVGYDGSAEARRAVERAVEYAKAFSCRLLVVSVTQPVSRRAGGKADGATTTSMVAPGATVPVALAPGAVPSAGELDDETSPGTADLEKRQREQARALVSDGSVDVELVSELGDTAERVLEIAERREAGLIVVGSREHGFFGRLFAKPVEERVAQRAAADVLLVH